MCGIVGYIGTKQAAPIMLDSLQKLEYRGYDSAGLAMLDGGTINVRKTHGRLSRLFEATHGGADMPGMLGIGHTRWATHGEPTDLNAHPHLSRSGRVALVHNGIIENYAELRDFLTEKGYDFVSETDTEIAVQLVDYLYEGDPLAAVRKAESMLVGSYALCILFSDFSDRLIAVRKDSPLILGVGEGENFVASDIPAILSHTRNVIRLGERELAVVKSGSLEIYDRFGERIEKEITEVTWDAASAEKGGYAHFMIKEIMEQPEVVRKTVSPRVHTGKIDLGLEKLTDEEIRALDRIYIVACGSAYHVGVVGKTYIEKFSHVPVTVSLASEFRYDDPIVTENTLTIVISQSGETIDTLFALREAKARGSRILSVVNVVGSSIAVESDDVLYTWAGPEIAVATTKAYSTQLTLLYLIALKLGECRGNLGADEINDALDMLNGLPALLEEELRDISGIQHLASLYFNSRDIFFIGRNVDYALALEGSLKLKEISYIHSDAYAAGELKHGTISLVEPGTLVVALCTYEPLREKMISNIREVKARGAAVIALAEEGAPGVDEVADHVIYLPKCGAMIRPSVAILPLQLFAYYVALLKGCDIDKPRNLAKSVTVE